MPLTQNDIQNIVEAITIGLDPKFEQIDRRFDRLEIRLINVENRIDKLWEDVAGDLATISEKMSNYHAKNSQLENTISEHNIRLAKLEKTAAK